MSIEHADLEALFSWCLPSPLALILFLPPLLLGSLSPEGRDLIQTSLLGLSVLRPLTLCVLSESLYLFPSAAGGSLFI